MNRVGTPLRRPRVFAYQLELAGQTSAEAAARRPYHLAVAQLEGQNCCLLLLGGSAISSIFEVH